MEDADRTPGGIRDVVPGPARVQHRPRLEAEQLLGLGVVREEADVLLDRHLLLPHKRDRPAERRLAGGQRRDPVEVRDRPDQLVDQITVVRKGVVRTHGARMLAVVVHRANDDHAGDQPPAAGRGKTKLRRVAARAACRGCTRRSRRRGARAHDRADQPG